MDEWIKRQDAINAIERAKTARSPDGEIYVAKINAQMNIQVLPSAEMELEPCDFCKHKDDCGYMSMYCPAERTEE